MDVLEELNKLTYKHEHSPNCLSPHLVRLVRPGAGKLDDLHHFVTGDVCGYGNTFAEAAADALKKRRALQKLHRATVIPIRGRVRRPT